MFFGKKENKKDHSVPQWAPDQQFQFRFYMAGNTKFNQEIMEVIKKVMDQKIPGRYSLQIVDVLDEPEQAQEDGIMATPTLAKVDPPPIRKFFGRLISPERVLSALASLGL
jgi:circadian clock protein KaiB